MTTVETTYGPLAYDELGAGPTLFMLPSGGHTRSDYDGLRSLIPRSLRTVAIDWPAHGESPPGPGPGSAMRMADLAEQALAALAPAGAIVIGNSVGGFAAARMAIRRPDLVAGLVIVDGGGFAPAAPQVRAFCALMSRPALLRAIYPSFSRAYMRSRTDADRSARQRAIETVRSGPGSRAVSELWRSFTSPEHDLRVLAPTITAPTLIVWGRRDPVIRVSVARRIGALIPGSELEVLDTGHVPHTSDPAAFAAVLLPFAERVFSASGEDRAAGGAVGDQLPV